MKNILLIIQREYLTRVKKKSFIILTLLVPLLMMGMWAGIIWAAMSGTDEKHISVIDESGFFVNKIGNGEMYSFEYIDTDLTEAKKAFPESGKDALVFIPADIMENPKSVQIFAERGVPLELKSKVEGAIEREIESIKLTEAGITRSVLEDAKLNVSSETISLNDGNEKKSSSTAATIIGFACAFLIYISVFIYGAQVMRGVMEEKTSRIVEVIISSVKPFQLMIGKIVGVALVGLTQFTLWIVLTLALFSIGGQVVGSKLQDMPDVSAVQSANLPPEVAAQMQQNQPDIGADVLPDIINAASTLPIATIIISFLFYFLGGYLLYSSLFGAVGSAVDGETDTQQFILPITIPIIAAFIIAQFVMRDPNGPLAFWASMVPFTSPIIMMVRIPFGVPIWQIALSIALLIGGFIFTTWLAARIYRIGILMYGKKVTWKELSKWVFYKG
ncbi:ABC transporter permease [Jiulongibacter sediminis]|uniref:ABC transporter permease n=1 Tax=Jiulongibacter sediminis TaxID=1605367 RepID=A0A0P7C094_9BACT|nr:ABC transporter permease [Jiulongibacter sediminis]KPM50045.1 ABC transporter permease [Jiulongibacter sediminis]TBX27071.1 ABC transporter permease [Jiulongibacter sediminis]